MCVEVKLSYGVLFSKVRVHIVCRQTLLPDSFKPYHISILGGHAIFPLDHPMDTR